MPDDQTMWVVYRDNAQSYTASLYGVNPLKFRELRLHADNIEDLREVFRGEGRKPHADERAPNGACEVWL